MTDLLRQTGEGGGRLRCLDPEARQPSKTGLVHGYCAAGVSAGVGRVMRWGGVHLSRVKH